VTSSEQKSKTESKEYAFTGASSASVRKYGQSLGATSNCVLKKFTLEPPLAHAFEIDKLRRQQQPASGLLIKSRVSLEYWLQPAFD
jgi:hypothetical protein